MSGKEILVALVAGLGFAGYTASAEPVRAAALPVQSDRMLTEAPVAPVTFPTSFTLAASAPAMGGPF